MSNIDGLCRDWLDARKAENEANARRIKIEAQLAEALEVPEEGSKTHKTEAHKITVGQPIYRKVDETAWAKVKDKIPENLRPVKVKIEADATGCKYLAKSEPALWKKIASAFTATPGKVSIKVEII